MKHVPIHRIRLFVVLTSAFLLALLLVGPRVMAGTKPGDFDCTIQTDIPQAECEALVALYLNADGDNWTNNDGWVVTNTPCNWYGVACGGGHVTYLDLFFNQMSGSISPELGNLNNLKKLDLSVNHLSGSIPPELGNLPDLRGLHLVNNQLNGEIPKELGNLSNLHDLRLAENQLSSSIPPELGRLSRLIHLDLRDNQLNGSIPPELGNLSHLEVLWLSDNQLSGSIPLELGNLSNLAGLWLLDNQLSGIIPPELGNLSNLWELGLADNQLSGIIPHELGNLSELRQFRLDGNQLSGTVPPGLGNLFFLNGFSLSDNQFSGSIPAGVCNNLGWLNLAYNKFTGEDDPCVTAKDSDWADTQTVSPANVQATVLSTDTIRLNWTPILYTDDGGYYEISYRLQAGSYQVHGVTESKFASDYTMDSLSPGTEYDFRVRTFTPAHGDQQNDLWSDYSHVVTATTLFFPPIYLPLFLRDYSTPPPT